MSSSLFSIIITPHAIHASAGAMLRGDRHLASTVQMDLGTVESRFQGTDGEKNSEYALPKELLPQDEAGFENEKSYNPQGSEVAPQGGRDLLNHWWRSKKVARAGRARRAVAKAQSHGQGSCTEEGLSWNSGCNSAENPAVILARHTASAASLVFGGCAFPPVSLGPAGDCPCKD